jgi:transcriptional regulator with XRE-family HTH domain
MDINVIKGRNLRRIRLHLKMTQREIGEIINDSEGNVSAMESGKRTLSDRKIGILCDKFKISFYEFSIEPDTPLPATDLERKALYTIREAEKMGAGYIAEEACNFTVHRLDIIKKQPPIIPDESRKVRDKAG